MVISSNQRFSTTYVQRLDLAPQGFSAKTTPSPTFLQRVQDTLPGFVRSFFGLDPLHNQPLVPNPHNPFQSPLSKPLYVFGDIHGELVGFYENLQNAGLIDAHSNWTGQDQVLVQLGDVIDRGFFSEECWVYLENLQQKAVESGGQVVRLIGNHELNLLQGKKILASFFLNDVDAFTEKLTNDVLSGRVQLAYTDGKRLYVHAGLRSKIRHQLMLEIKELKKCSVDEVYLEDIVQYVNSLLIQAIQEKDFSHTIFNVGPLRGGSDSRGGMLWVDLKELLDSNHARALPQVIGHNPPRHPEDPPIRITETQGLIEVDAGMNAIYGGRRAYVVFSKDQIKVRHKNAENQQWQEKIAPDLIGA